MDMTTKATVLPSPAARSERLPDLAGYAMTVAFIVLGVDLRAVALGGLWVRAIFPVRI